MRGVTDASGASWLKGIAVRLRVHRNTWVLIIACLLSWGAFATRPNGWAQLASMLSALVALAWIGALAVQGLARVRERGLSSLASCLLIIAAFPLAVVTGTLLRYAIFSFNLDRWNEAVAWVTANHPPNHSERITLPRKYASLAYAVHYRQSDECGPMVDFFWGGGFPVKHVVRRHAVNPDWIEVKECRQGWSRGRSLSGHWYEISD